MHLLLFLWYGPTITATDQYVRGNRYKETLYNDVSLKKTQHNDPVRGEIVG